MNAPETCEHNDSGWLYLHSRCHIGEPAYVKVKGHTLIVQCARCEETIATFLIEHENSDPPISFALEEL